MKLFKKKKRKQEKWINVWHGKQWMNVKESHLQRVIIVKDREGKEYALNVRT